MVSSKYATKKRASKAKGPSTALVPAPKEKEVAALNPDDAMEELALQAQGGEVRSKRRQDREEDREESRPKRLRSDGSKTGETEAPKTSPAHVECGPYLYDPQTPPPKPIVRRMETMKMDLHRLYSPRSPSLVDMTESTSPSTFCVKEREWLASLPVNLLFTETHRFCDMARLGIAEAWRYAALLEEQCRRLDDGEIEGSTNDGEARKRVEAELEELKKKMSEQSQEADDLVKKANEKIARLVQARKDAKKNRDELANKVKDAEKKRDELANQVTQWRTKYEALEKSKLECESAMKEKDVLLAKAAGSEEEFKTKFLRSEEFKELVGEQIYPHWQHGIRVGIRQAVARFEADKSNIAIFEPDYENHCGEPEIEDSDEEAA